MSAERRPQKNGPCGKGCLSNYFGYFYYESEVGGDRPREPGADQGWRKILIERDDFPRG